MNILGSNCQWPDTEETQRRLQFCNRIEGYGSVCSCDEPASLTFSPEPVSIPSSLICYLSSYKQFCFI